jgi:rRNA maturation endonuclease Nob1
MTALFRDLTLGGALIPPAPLRIATWRLCCLLCGRAVEVQHRPFPRRCQACGGYLEARRTREWESC